MRRNDFAAAWAVSDLALAGRDPATRDDPARPYHERWVWDGTPPDGRHVLVRCYHGLGDTLMFARFLAALCCRAASVTVEAQPELAPLLAGPWCIREFDPARPLPPAELDLEIMELAHALRLRPEDGDDRAPALRAAARLPPQAAHPPKDSPQQPRTGFVWHTTGWDPGRNVPPHHLAPVLARTIPVGLQRGPAAAALPIPDPLHGSMDLVALLRLVATLDAVVTIDTMVAHLAASIGVPTHILLQHEADWRWGDGPATPWYPAARLHRQPAPGDWAGAIDGLLGTFLGNEGS